MVVSSEASFGSMGPTIRRSIQQILLKSYQDVRVTEVNSIRNLESIVSRKPDLIFLGASRLSNNLSKETVWLSTFFEERGIACSGSDSSAHNLERNKQLAKDRVLESGFATASSFVVSKENGIKVVMHDLTYPLFVKPIDKGGGIGIDDASFIQTHQQLEAKIRSISALQKTDSLVEEYLPGKEFSVALLFNTLEQQYDVMPIELQTGIITSGASMLSHQVKADNSESVSVLTDSDEMNYISKQALGMFEALGGRDYGRIDLRLDKNGVAHFLEANLFPSLTEDYGSFPKACLLNKGLLQDQIITKIAQLGFERSVKNVAVAT